MSSKSITLPISVTIMVDLGFFNKINPEPKKAYDWLVDYFNGPGKKSVNDFDLDPKYSAGNSMLFKFTGDGVWDYEPAYSGSSSEPDQPESLSGPEIDPDLFLDAVKSAVKKMPFDVEITNEVDDFYEKSMKDPYFIDTDIVVDAEEIPSDEDVYSELSESANKAVNESIVKLPYSEEITLDMSDIDDETQIAPLARYLETGLHKEFDVDDLDISVKVESDEIVINLSGDLEYEVVPGTPATWNDPGDPDDFIGPEEDFAIYEISYLLKTYPENISFSNGSNSYKLHDEHTYKNLPQRTDGGTPSDEEVYDKLYQAEIDAESAYADMMYDRWKDSKYESVLNSVLDGKTLTEALNERAGDWDIESQEMVSSSDINKAEYDKEYTEFIKESKEHFSTFLSGMKALVKVLNMCYTYGVPYFDAEGCPFKNLAAVSKDCENWVENIMEMVEESK